MANPRFSDGFFVGTLLLVILASVGCRVTDLPLWHPFHDEGSRLHDVHEVLGLAYQPGPWAFARQNTLDLYLPKGAKEYPVVVFVHGGAWMTGDNRCCGLYSSIGKYLASQGIGVAMPNYRLSPWVKHPEHLRDVATAVGWVKTHVADFGGDPERLFLAGHSAGGHLVSLLATEGETLAAAGVEASELRGVVAISGVYRIPTEKLAVALGGEVAPALKLQQMFPIRTPKSPTPSGADSTPGLPISFDLFAPVFGPDAEVRRRASPIERVRPGLPPFLLVSAEMDLPLLNEMAEEFHEALQKQGNRSRRLHVPDRNHNSIVFHAAEPSDPVAQAVVAFVREHAPRR